ncbi:acetylornithine aminotransferase [Terasakiispira papahanaumokuakeensis]|uniref:Acetylornithine aminotransferase n=1 Tax=Terasakiispira papahanaumokuakeensis TaxID=197479 RepID=A0A1E2VBN6_9GAMM|nr:acetylornithine/succinylornithine family transaminase [Terasakiispira papahanaumokuakeensis]ODC04364.1 acetylornithine aminotransferase [Terasakiispira papahanaumokuakeensis]
MSWTPSREDFDHYFVPNYAPQPELLVRGEGSRVWDQNDREYVDFAGGIAVNALGHRHPVLMEALKTQAEHIWHLSNVYANEPEIRLARSLVEHTFADKVFLCSSGLEANEAAFKLARRHAYLKHGEAKHKIIAFKQSFHGRSLFTVTVGGQEKYTEGFRPAPQGIVHAEFNDLESVRALMDDTTCAVVVEPMQGEGGVRPADADFLKGLRTLCDQYEALLVFDEVQSGVGRTGELYAYMHYGVKPDILTSAKALGGGFPVGAMLATDEVAPSLGVGTHGSTYGGNPLASAVSYAALEFIRQPEVLAGVKERHEWFVSGLKRISDNHGGLFKEVRGMGLLIGAEMADPWHGRAKDLLQAAMAEGVMTLVAGPNILRLAPSLIIPPSDVEEGLARLERAVKRLAN